MKTVHVERSDESVDRIVRAAWPGYKGRKVHAVIADTIRFHGTNWDDGSRRDYVCLRLADLARHGIEEAPYFRGSALHESEIPIPPGVVVVVLVHFRGNQRVEIVGPAANITPMLPAPADLTDDERTVLLATRSLKSNYGGVKDFRFVEARRRTGITADRWEAARSALRSRGMLDGRGAITTAGKNAVSGLSF